MMTGLSGLDERLLSESFGQNDERLTVEVLSSSI